MKYWLNIFYTIFSVTQSDQCHTCFRHYRNLGTLRQHIRNSRLETSGISQPLVSDRSFRTFLRPHFRLSKWHCKIPCRWTLLESHKCATDQLCLLQRWWPATVGAQDPRSRPQWTSLLAGEIPDPLMCPRGLPSPRLTARRGSTATGCKSWIYLYKKSKNPGSYLFASLVVTAIPAPGLTDPIILALFANALAATVVEPSVRSCADGHAGLLALLLAHALAVVHHSAVWRLRFGVDSCRQTDFLPFFRRPFILVLQCLGCGVNDVGQNGFLQDGGVWSRTQPDAWATLNLWKYQKWIFLD